MDEKIKMLHDNNIAHGDLHIRNIVFNINPLDVKLIDFEHSFNISNITSEVMNWMINGFDFKGTINEFIDYDYTNYKSYLGC